MVTTPCEILEVNIWKTRFFLMTNKAHIFILQVVALLE